MQNDIGVNPTEKSKEKTTRLRIMRNNTGVNLS